MKRKMNRVLCLVTLAVALAFGLVVTGCGGNDPKSLAKQTYELQQQALKAGNDVAKAASLGLKASNIALKAQKLSDADQAVYTKELVRLTSGGQ
jgi:hypothetical protein